MAAAQVIGMLPNSTQHRRRDGFTALLGQAPRAVAAFVAPGNCQALRQDALLQTLLPLAGFSGALVWL
jgi:hypothetical protein